MTAHLHTVMRLHKLGGPTWFHYDWKARRETCAIGPAEWGRCGNFCVLQEVETWKTHLTLYLRGLHQAVEQGFFQLHQVEPGNHHPNKGLVEVVPASRVESADYSTGHLLAAHMVTSVSLFIDAQSAGVLTMVGGTVLKKVGAKAHKETEGAEKKNHVVG